MMFNLADYGRALMAEFTAAGGTFQHMELHAPGDVTRLKEKVVINCPGYGARALWGDETVTPVRGQIGWLIPQPEVTYSLLYRDVIMLSRRDGIAIQAVGGNWRGFYDSNEAPDRVEAETAINTIAELYAKFPSRPA
jgi:glycine/D-amino acid oxidase-like deaminating enzyme